MQIELDSITKTFGTRRANSDISLTVPPASITGILGENGAGKSTLMKILSGFSRPDSGSILLDGVQASIRSPADAITLGIGMLHQDPLDFPPMKIVDNFMLGAKHGFFPDRRSASRDFRELASRFDFSLDPESYVDTLSVGERQQLEILRLLWLGAKVLILDEPTTGISLPQKLKLFETLKKLGAEGMSILFVSHKLEDVEALCSSAVVLRKGELVGSASAPFDTASLVRLMFGKDVDVSGMPSSTIPPAASRDYGASAPALGTKALCFDAGRLRISGVDLSVAKGEVVGLAGMEGSGQAAFLGACAALVHRTAGTISVGGLDMAGKSHHDFKRAGVAYIPAARLEEALVPGMSLEDHFVLSEESESFFVRRRRARDLANDRIESFNIKGSPESPVESLSGGNQQRALLALLRDDLSLVLVEHPTRGLDIESTAYVWEKLKARCARGCSIVFISSDLDEILRYADRVMVFYSGKVTPPLPAAALSVERLGELIGGKAEVFNA